MRTTALMMAAALPLVASAAVTEFKILSKQPYGDFAAG